MDQYIRQSWDTLIDAWHTASSTTANSLTNKMTYYTSGGLGNLPTIPSKLRNENAVILGVSGYRFVHTVASKVLEGPDTSWGSIGLTAILGVCHLERGMGLRKPAESAFYTSTNPYRILEMREFGRLITGQVYHSSTTSFLNNVVDVCNSTATIESVWGWQGMLASVSFTSLLGQVLYIVSTHIARTWYPASELAKEFYRFSTGLTITSAGLNTLSGYLLDGVEMSRSSNHDSLVWRHRYQWSMHLLLTGTLLTMSSNCMQKSSTSSSYASLEVPSLYASASGVVAGIVTSYLLDGPWRCPTLELSCADIALQSALLGISMFSLRSV
jgi:hypothetical protein